MSQESASLAIDGLIRRRLEIVISDTEIAFSQDPDATLRFHRASALSDSDIAAVEATTRARVLRLFEREGLLRAWTHECRECRQGLFLQSSCIPAIHGGQMHESGLSADTVEQMRAWDHAGGFSVDASVCVGARGPGRLKFLPSPSVTGWCAPRTGFTLRCSPAPIWCFATKTAA